MSRLRSVLTTARRADLSKELCARAVAAAQEAGLRVAIVSSSEAVMAWTQMIGVEWLPDPGEGLSAAAASAVASMNEAPWMVMHADLPLVSSRAVHAIAEASVKRTVLVPSSDGGTNVIASRGSFAFSFGPNSFERHFATVPTAAVMPGPELSIDIDTPLHLSVFPEVLRASSLRS
jgi:2-phospho-L-lactate guanylyltransferase